METVKLLHKLGAEIKHTDRRGWNGMMRAAFGENIEIITYLHNQNSQLIHAEGEYGDTAFTIACLNASLETVKLLHKLGADINHIDEFKKTGLMTAAIEGNTEIIDYIISKCPKQIHAIDINNNSAFTVAKDFSTILFILESVFNSSQDRRNRETSVVTFQFRHSTSSIDVFEEAFLVTCQYGDVTTGRMMLENNMTHYGTKSKDKLNCHSKNYLKRNGFFLAALHSRIDIMFYLKSYDVKLTASTDTFGITCSLDPSEITCKFMTTSDDSLSITDIDSVSQTGVLKQRKIVKRLKQSVRRLNQQTEDTYVPTFFDEQRKRQQEIVPSPVNQESLVQESMLNFKEEPEDIAEVCMDTMDDDEQHAQPTDSLFSQVLKYFSLNKYQKQDIGGSIPRWIKNPAKMLDDSFTKSILKQYLTVKIQDNVIQENSNHESFVPDGTVAPVNSVLEQFSFFNIQGNSIQEDSNHDGMITTAHVETPAHSAATIYSVFGRSQNHKQREDFAREEFEKAEKSRKRNLQPDSNDSVEHPVSKKTKPEKQILSVNSIV